jgi:hypothetical protein
MLGLKKFLMLALVPIFFAACSDDPVGPELLDGDVEVSASHHQHGDSSADSEDVTLACHIGRAQGIVGTVKALLVTTSINLADTGELGCDGAERDATVLEASVDGVLTADALAATTVGVGKETHSDAATTNLALSLAGLNVTASLLRAEARAKCVPFDVLPKGVSVLLEGDSEVLDLRVNGVAVTVTGQANQRVDVAPGVYLVINEQTRTDHDITVGALRVVVEGTANIAISSAKAGAICTT